MVLIHEPTKSVVLNVSDPAYIQSLIPKFSKSLAHPDYNLAVKHTMESTRVLRNLGYDVPSPIQYQYPWPGKYSPFDHQRLMSDFLTLNDKCFNLSEMGTMKTASALWAADYLMSVGEVRSAAIFSPMSTMDTVWKQDIFDTLMHRTCGIVHGSMEHRLKVLSSPLDFYVVNHDGVVLTEVVKCIRRRKDIDLIIVDEVSMFRNSLTDKYKFLEWLVEKKKRVWLISGTPCPNAPTDAWALARLIDKSKVPRWFGSFQRETMLKVSEHRWVPKKDAKDKAYAALRPAVRFLKKDCIDLPPVVTENRQTSMSKQQTQLFEQMRKELVIDMAHGQITAVNAADKINKLRQILCGVIKDPASSDYILLDHKKRLRDLEDVLDEAAAKAIVIVPFKGIIRTLAQELEAHGHTVGVINGDVSPKMRDQIINQFKHEEHPQTLLCHPRVMSHGLNLTVADVTAFYAPIYSGDEYEQVIERFNRAGQTRKMTLVRLGAHPLEWEIYRMVDTKRLNQKTILDLFDTITY
jgi:hypothetical protein